MDSDADADAAAMAQAMGFSSFGTQDRPLKKRRYNAAADSISSAETAPQPQATGSNTTPLAAPGAKSCANAEEIDLHDEDDEVGEKDDHNDEAIPLQASQVSIKAAPAGLPARPAPGIGFVGTVSSESDAHAPAPRSRPGKPAQRSHNELWYKDYYDSTSNENPWERLEKAMGLATKGIWVSGSEGAAAAPAPAPAVSLTG
ncbi:hypothetical protein E4U54_008568 [Claviceps lovelessii]|nr:hypothetical protein E4U54_008568 [Claviceps lovelessii]